MRTARTESAHVCAAGVAAYSFTYYATQLVLHICFGDVRIHAVARRLTGSFLSQVCEFFVGNSLKVALSSKTLLLVE